jgi:hypothetical protein
MDEFRSAIALWVNIYDIFGWSIQILWCHYEYTEAFLELEYYFPHKTATTNVNMVFENIFALLQQKDIYIYSY